MSDLANRVVRETQYGSAAHRMNALRRFVAIAQACGCDVCRITGPMAQSTINELQFTGNDRRLA